MPLPTSLLCLDPSPLLSAARRFLVGTYHYVHYDFTLISIPTTAWSIILCIVLADRVYYWEQRFTHRVGIVWATHTVYHSSPYFNISVAYRFGPLDGFFALFFHLPLVLARFHPLLVLFAEAPFNSTKHPCMPKRLESYPNLLRPS